MPRAIPESPWKTFHVRPEDEKAVHEHYSPEEAKRYAESNAMRRIQRQLTLRALELARIPLSARVLDAGCGTGFSLEVLEEARYKKIAGFDAVPSLLEFAEKKGFKVRQGDLRDIPFQSNSFDAIVSISVLQWILAKDAKENAAKAAKEFRRVLSPRGIAVIQFYPLSEEEAMLAARAFKNEGFKTTLVTDNLRNPRKRKVFMLLRRG
ncbi:MAG: methyltransferase domain-containing protein [Candidatus Micrarchaeota archaeon]